LHRIDDQNARHVEEQHGEGVDLPAHLLIGPDSAQPIDEPLEPAERAIEPHGAPLIDARHVGPERLGQEQEDDQVQQELQHAVRRHWKSSGLSNASVRYTSNPSDTTPPTT
jgi:hypothetical protein